MQVNLTICVFVHLLNLILREKFESERGFELGPPDLELIKKFYVLIAIYWSNHKELKFWFQVLQLYSIICPFFFNMRLLVKDFLSRVWTLEPWISRRARYPETTEALVTVYVENIKVLNAESAYNLEGVLKFMFSRRGNSPKKVWDPEV